MKKIILTILATVLLLTSCTFIADPSDSSADSQNGDIPNISETVRSLYTFRMSDGSPLGFNRKGIPLKINLINGVTMPVCSDPLCLHNTEECPFYDCSGALCDGDIMFFRKGWLVQKDGVYSGKEILCTYNIINGEVNQLAEYEDSIVAAGVHRQYFYYYIASWNDTDSTLKCTYKLYRADGKSGKIIEIPQNGSYSTTGGFTSNNDYPNIYTIDGGMIYWYTYEMKENGQTETAFYTTDLAGEDKQDIGTHRNTGGLFHKGYLYTIVSKLTALPKPGASVNYATDAVYDLARQEICGDTHEVVAENIGSSNFILSDNYIYFLECDNILQEEDLSLTLNGCRVVRIPISGGEREFVAETNAYQFKQRLMGSDEIMLDVKTDENGVDYIAFAFYEANENGKTEKSPDTLILNTNDGIWSVSRYK